MNQQNHIVQFEFDPSVEHEVLRDMEKSIAELNGIGHCRIKVPRSAVDPGSLIVWVTLLGTIFRTVESAMPIITKIVELIRSKGIQGVRLVLSDGREFSVDHLTAEELEQLISPRKTAGS